MILNGSIFSNTLEMNTGLSVIMPNQGRPKEGYGVVYLLHGLCGSHNDWIEHTLLANYAERGNSIFIMPEVSRSFYADMEYGLAYFTYVAEELPIRCKEYFQISAWRENTIVMGGSMGGYGALKCALSKPEQYGGCYAFASACLFLKEFLTLPAAKEQRAEVLEERRKIYGDRLMQDFRAIFGQQLACRPGDDLLELAKGIAGEKPRLYLSCGKKDPFYQDNTRFVQEMQGLGFDTAFETWGAGHDWDFFQEALKRAAGDLQGSEEKRIL